MEYGKAPLQNHLNNPPKPAEVAVSPISGTAPRWSTGSSRAGRATRGVALLEGRRSLEELRAAGVNTEVVRKARRRSRATASGEKVTEFEVELYDRAGEAFDRICDRTEGRPRQSVTHAAAEESELRTPEDGAAALARLLARLRQQLGSKEAGHDGGPAEATA